MSTEVKRMFKVLCPVERNGKTHWSRLGTAFPNRDQSINLYLDANPINGKLQLREYEEEDYAARDGGRGRGGGRGVTAEAGADDALPF